MLLDSGFRRNDEQEACLSIFVTLANLSSTPGQAPESRSRFLKGKPYRQLNPGGSGLHICICGKEKQDRLQVRRGMLGVIGVYL